MTTKLEQAALQALDALEEMFHSNSTKVAVEKYNTAHNALREALLEPIHKKDMTDEEINKISSSISNAMLTNMTVEDWKRSFARAVIAADREKNK